MKSMPMTRKEFIKYAGFTALGVIAIPQISSAQAVPPTVPPTAPIKKEVLIAAEIESNHGHEFPLTIVEVVLLLRQLQKVKSVTASIQGASGHGHDVTLDEPSLIALLKTGELSLVSSNGSGHTHGVELTLSVVGS